MSIFHPPREMDRFLGCATGVPFVSPYITTRGNSPHCPPLPNEWSDYFMFFLVRLLVRSVVICLLLRFYFLGPPVVPFSLLGEGFPATIDYRRNKTLGTGPREGSLETGKLPLMCLWLDLREVLAPNQVRLLHFPLGRFSTRTVQAKLWGPFGRDSKGRLNSWCYHVQTGGPPFSSWSDHFLRPANGLEPGAVQPAHAAAAGGRRAAGTL